MNQVAAINPGLAAAQAANAKRKAEKEAAVAAKAAEPKKERKERDPLSVVERTKLGNFVEGEYVKSRLTDAEFAELASKHLGRDVSVSTITTFREGYGLSAPATMSASEMRARIRALEDEVARLSQPQAEIPTEV